MKIHFYNEYTISFTGKCGAFCQQLDVADISFVIPANSEFTVENCDCNKVKFRIQIHGLQLQIALDYYSPHYYIN